jgi:hypothetical protein
VTTTSRATTTSTTTTTLAAGPAGVVEADTWVWSEQPAANFGNDALLSADAGPSVKIAFLRVRVTGVGTRRVTSALLRLQVANVTRAESVAGGRPHLMTDCGWDERTITWNTRPGIGGPALATAGAVARGQQVTFDVTAAITRDGVYCFALDTVSTDGVDYNSREGSAQRPTVSIATAP